MTLRLSAENLIDECELSWLAKNPKALEAVKEGLKQSKEGKVSSANIDFSSFADKSKNRFRLGI